MKPPKISERQVMRTSSFHDQTPALTTETFHPADRHVIVDVRYSSVGSTDLAARRGDYLLHPFPGFISGYDVAGIVVRAPEGSRLIKGDRVVALLPRMGAHASAVAANSGLFVKLPESLALDVAATLPLDAVTAKYALDTAGESVDSVFISGVSGPVGRLVAQLALNRGLLVAGTASPGKAQDLSSLGVHIYDYHDELWCEKLISELGKFDAVIDHTGNLSIRQIAKRSGRVVRIAFADAGGHWKRSTVIGFMRTVALSLSRPSERVCSTPLYVETHRAGYRRDLQFMLEAVASGAISPLTPRIYLSSDVAHAFQALGTGSKSVLEFE